MEESFVTKYFSFIILGLVLCIGYVMLRTRKKSGDGEWGGVERALQEAEREVRGLKGGEAGDGLASGIEHDALLRRARKAVEKSPAADAPPNQREEPPT